MALLTPPDILPEAMRYLVRAILALPRPPADRDELIGLVAPRGLTEAMESLTAAADLTDAEPDDLRTGGAVIARASLDALRALGIVQQDGSQVKLSAAVAGQWNKPTDVTAQTMCRQLLDSALRTADPQAPYGAASGSTDLAQATVLLQSADHPLLPFDRFESAAAGRSFDTVQLETCGPNRANWPVPNKEQWLSFRRWTAYLGLARPVGTNGLIPDASEALIRRLFTQQPGDYDIGDFVVHCARAVPVLEGGALFGERMPSADGENGVLSGGLSVSLLQLEAGGFIDMHKPKSDTERNARILRLRPNRSADRGVGTVTWHATSARRGA